MKKKPTPVLQKPLVLAGLFLVMIVALALVIQSYPGRDKEVPLPKKEIRSGDQVARVTILPKEDGTQETTAQTEETVETPPVEEDQPVAALPPVQFRIDRFQLLAVQPLKFQVFDGTGGELTPEYLENIRGSKVHFFIVHANMGLFHHILPNYANGVWNARSDMPLTGTYYAYIMVDPIKGDPKVHRYDLVTRTASPPDVHRSNPTLSASSGPFTATLEMKRFDDYRGFLYEVKRGGASTVIIPQRDALGEMTLFSHGSPSFFKHVTADAASEERLGKVSFSMEHLPAGRYTAFLEVLIDGQTRTFSHTFDIGT